MFLGSAVKTALLNLIYHRAGMVVHIGLLKFSIALGIVNKLTNILNYQPTVLMMDSKLNLIAYW